MEKKQNIFLIIPVFLLFVFLCNDDLSAREIDYFNKPQAGVWFGILTPVYTTYNQVNTSLGGGAYFRTSTPLESFKVGLDSSYQYYKQPGLYGVKGMTLVPVYGNLLYRLPLPPRFPLIFQLKAGAGGSWVEIRPENQSQWDPMFMAGIEGSFGVGRLVNIGFRIDYLCIYEKYISGAKRNGHVLNTGITCFFNL